MRLHEIETKSSKFFEVSNTFTPEQEYELFVDALQSEDFAYARARRTSQYTDVYEVIVYLNCEDSPTGVWAAADLPLNLALKALHDHSKPLFGSII